MKIAYGDECHVRKCLNGLKESQELFENDRRLGRSITSLTDTNIALSTRNLVLRVPP